MPIHSFVHSFVYDVWSPTDAAHSAASASWCFLAYNRRARQVLNVNHWQWLCFSAEQRPFVHQLSAGFNRLPQCAVWAEIWCDYCTSQWHVHWTQWRTEVFHRYTTNRGANSSDICGSFHVVVVLDVDVDVENVLAQAERLFARLWSGLRTKNM